MDVETFCWNIFKETASCIYCRFKKSIGGEIKTCDEVISELKSLSSEKYKANVVKMGIPEANSIGVSTGDIRKLAKGIGKSNEFAYKLWWTGYHEAKLLAVLVFDKKSISLHDVEQLINDVSSWDLCDHLCKNLIMKLKGY